MMLNEHLTFALLDITPSGTGCDLDDSEATHLERAGDLHGAHLTCGLGVG
jgi:hypothetical protein